MKSTAYQTNACDKCLIIRFTPSIQYGTRQEYDKMQEWWVSRGRFSTINAQAIDKCYGCGLVARYRMKVMVLMMMRLGVRI